MAGSQTWRVYESDNGDKFSVLVAKSIADGIYGLDQGGFADGQILFPVRDSDYPPMPSGMKMRYLNLRSSLPNVSRQKLNIRVFCGNPLIIKSLSIQFQTITFSRGVYAIGTYYDISSYQGEFRNVELGKLQYDG